MQSLRVTLYEVFGYVAPGIIAIIAITIGIWGIYYPAVAIPVAWPRYNSVLFGIVAFVAYMIGHLVQALGNLLRKAEKRPWLCESCGPLMNCALDNLRQNFYVKDSVQSLPDVISLAHAVLSQNGNANEYEVFVYREGFYRGAAVSLIFCSIALALRASHSTFLQLTRQIITVPRSLVIISALVSVTTSVLFYFRFLRFGEYRIRHVLGVIAIISPTAHSEQGTNKEK